MSFTKLVNQGFLRLTGSDSLTLLQNLTTNQMLNAGNLYTALLNPQGRVLFDAFVHNMQDSYLINVHQDSMDGLESHLARYRLRLKVSMQRVDFNIWQAWNKSCTMGYTDPRHADLGNRIPLPAGQTPQLNTFEHVSYDRYLENRFKLGIAEGPSEIVTSQALPLEHNFDYLNGIDFAKGCYLGQELTIRTHHTGVVRLYT
jgi:folate-binding protein YgfZ